MALSRSTGEQITGTEHLAFPVVIRADDGCFTLIRDDPEFLNEFELQYLSDSAFGGWDSRGRSFRFTEQSNGAWIRAELGPKGLSELETSLTQFFALAAQNPGWVSLQSQQAIRGWFESLVSSMEHQE